MFEIKNKIAVVVGGGRGIGKAISLQLAQEGAKVYIIETNLVKSNYNHYKTTKIGGFSEAKVLEKINSNIFAIQADASDENELIKGLNTIMDKEESVHILVNAIGITIVDQTIDTTTEAFNSVINTNLVAPFIASREVVKIMLKNNIKGSIINISSIAGKIGFPGISAYSASKFGLIGFTISLALELAEKNIQVNAICPGIVKTNMWKYLQEKMIMENENKNEFWLRMEDLIPQKKVQTAESIAQFAINIIKNDYITGQALSIDGGWYRAG